MLKSQVVQVLGMLSAMSVLASGCIVDLRKFNGEYLGQLSWQDSSHPMTQEKVYLSVNTNDPGSVKLMGQMSFGRWESELKLNRTVDLITVNISGLVRFSGVLKKVRGTYCFESPQGASQLTESIVCRRF